MMKSILIVLVSAAFFHVANSDVECFYDKMMKKVADIKPDVDVVENLCQEYNESFAELRQDIKDCKINKVKVDGLQSLVEDFCTKDELKTELVKKESCLAEKYPLFIMCMPISTTAETPKEQMKFNCDNRKKMLACANSDWGKPCEAEVLMKRVTDAMEDFYVGWCAEVDGASVNKVFSWSLISGVLFVMMYWKQRI